MTGGVAHVRLEDIAKRFGGVTALDGISMEIETGSIHALVGENGAGKSTLGNVVAGSIQPDAGRVLIDGAAVSLRSPREALEHGIAAIAQELLVVPRLSAAENVFLGAEPRRAGCVRRGALRRRYEALAAEAGFDLPADQPAGTMRTAQQQQVEILRALARDARLIVMDEPSAALSRPDTMRLHEIIRSLARAGKTVLLVSHFLREVLEARRYGHGSARWSPDPDRDSVRGDRGVADRRHARPAAGSGVSSQGAEPGRCAAGAVGDRAERAWCQRSVA